MLCFMSLHFYRYFMNATLLRSISFMQLAAQLAEEEFKTPNKFKMYKLFNKIKNTISSKKVIMPNSVESLKEDISIQ